MRPRYYCDHCNKGSGSPSYMRRHEAACTNNHGRRCGMCVLLGNEQRTAQSVNVARTLLDPGADYRAIMERVREVTGNCPACILAALRLSGAMALGYNDADDAAFGEVEPWRWDGNLFGFNFKDERKEASNRIVHEAGY